MKQSKYLLEKKKYLDFFFSHKNADKTLYDYRANGYQLFLQLQHGKRWEAILGTLRWHTDTSYGYNNIHKIQSFTIYTSWNVSCMTPSQSGNIQHSTN